MMGIAHALFMNRLHLLRLTEVVRLQINPQSEASGIMELPSELDKEMQQQAFNFVLQSFPKEFSLLIHEAKSSWMRLT